MTHTYDHEHVLDQRGVQAVEYDADDDTVRVFVERKLPEDDLDDEEVISNSVSYTKTDVVEVGNIEAQFKEIPQAQKATGKQHRPVVAGVSEMNVNGTAATGGPLARVVDTQRHEDVEWHGSATEGDLVRLSNCHVYARSNAATLGEDITQPSPMDGGTEGDVVGEYIASVPLKDGAIVDVAARSANTVEESFDSHDLDEKYGDAIFGGDYTETRNESVIKSGRTTGITEASVQATTASVNVGYGNETYLLRDQILTEAMSEGGDSGSPVFLTETGELFGLLFAGSPSITVLNKISNIEAQLGIEIVTALPPEPDQPEETPPETDPDTGNGSGGTDDGSGDTSNDGSGDGSDKPKKPKNYEKPFVSPIDISAVAEKFDLSEMEFEEIVEAWMKDTYGEENVDRQFYLKQSGRWADLMLKTPLITYAIEVERGWEPTFKGVGQTLVYAAHNERYQPMVILPEGEIEQPEAEYLRRYVPIIEFPVPDESGSGSE